MPTRFAIQVTYPSGEQTYLRRGSRIGEGPVVAFDRQTADINAEMLRAGLDADVTVQVIKWQKSASLTRRVT